MSVILEFILSAQMEPFYYYLLSYFFIWLVALPISRLFISNDRNFELGANSASLIGLILHCITGFVFVYYMWNDFQAGSLHWVYYLVPYIVLLFLNVFFVLSLVQQRVKLN